jgi:hypothetical protein
MERVIYCPDDSMIQEAESLAKDQILPIIVGDSERFNDTKFDRTKVQIVFIPQDQYLNVPRSILSVNQLLTVEYVDEFDSVLNAKCVLVEKRNGYTIECGLTSLSTEHRAMFRAEMTTPGYFAGEIRDSNGVIATFDVKVL